MRRRLRGLCLLLFIAGLVVFVADATRFRISRESGGESGERTDQPYPRYGLALGLAIQALGVTGYLAIATLWPRRARG
jgi:hypothetical protein